MYPRHGFTLIELMIVVAIIGLLAAIAIPNLLRANMNANEASAISNLRAVSAAQVSFRAAKRRYAGSFDELTYQDAEARPYLDGIWTGVKDGYVFALAPSGGGYTATASPEIVDKSGSRAFYVDQTNLVRWVDGAGPAGPESLPLDQRE